VPLSEQVPVPLQVSGSISVEPVQDCATHSVPEAWSRQAPDPLHCPSVEHVLAGWAAHSFSGSTPAVVAAQAAAPLQLRQVPAHSESGSVLAGTLVQVPTDPVSPQDWQVPPQAVLQQTPSTQFPVRHSALPLQVWPLPF
jgi:hypothetical protein